MGGSATVRVRSELMKIDDWRGSAESARTNVTLRAKARDLSGWIDWAAPIDAPETKRMLEWARKRLASIERAVNPNRFGAWLWAKKLFPEVDRFAPLPGLLPVLWTVG